MFVAAGLSTILALATRPPLPPRADIRPLTLGERLGRWKVGPLPRARPRADGRPETDAEFMERIDRYAATLPTPEQMQADVVAVFLKCDREQLALNQLLREACEERINDPMSGDFYRRWLLELAHEDAKLKKRIQALVKDGYEAVRKEDEAVPPEPKSAPPAPRK